MKILLFIVLFFISIYFIPDVWVVDLVKEKIYISGDGEEAMDCFEMYIIEIKTVICGFGTWLLMKLICWLRYDIPNR